MELAEVVAVLGGLADAGVTVWVDGGWGVDALIGTQSRDHEDLDIAVNREDETALNHWLAARRYIPRQHPEDSAWNYVLQDASGHAIDVHVFEFDDAGNHSYGVSYPAESLAGTASLGDIRVHCIAPEWMFRFKTGYAPRPRDLADVRALADKFGYEVPPTHQRPQ